MLLQLPRLHEELCCLLVGIVLVLIPLVTLWAGFPTTFLLGPELPHEVVHLLDVPSIMGKPHCIGCQICCSNTSVLSMATEEDDVLYPLIFLEGLADPFWTPPASAPCPFATMVVSTLVLLP